MDGNDEYEAFRGARMGNGPHGRDGNPSVSDMLRALWLALFGRGE